MIEFQVLGGLHLRARRPSGTRDALIQPKRLALLLYLALAEPPGLHARDRLLALLWPEADEESARHSLRNGLHALRQRLGDVIVTRGDGFVGLDFGKFRCDALELRGLLRAGQVEDAVALWRGELAAGFNVSDAPEFEHWLDAQRAELHRSVVAAAWKRANDLAGAGEGEVDAVRRAVRLDPGNEPGARRLMRLLAEAGDRGGALGAYQELAAHLARELETEPSPETRAMAGTLREPVVTARAPLRPPIAVTRPPALSPNEAIAAAVPETPAPSPNDVVAPAAPVRRPRHGALAMSAVTLLALLALRSGPQLSLASAPAPVRSDAERAALRLPARYRADTAAYASYLRGLQLRFEFHFMASRDTMAALAERDPLYVPGLYGLAHAYIFTALNGLTDPAETWLKVDALAHRALALDSTSASAWLALAGEDMFFRRDLPRARERIERARRLDPLDPEVRSVSSSWFRFQGEMDSAVAESRLAHRLDPMSRLLARRLAVDLFLARRYDESRVEYTNLLRDDPRWMRGYDELAQLFRAMGRPRDAVTWLRRARAAQGDTAGAALLHEAATDSAAALLLAADARRSIERMDAAARSGAGVFAADYAQAYAVLGDTVATLNWLDSVLARHEDAHNIRLDPALDFVRALPRYRAWEARTGLPPMTWTPPAATGRPDGANRRRTSASTGSSSGSAPRHSASSR